VTYVNSQFKGAHHNNRGINAYTNYPQITIVSMMIESFVTDCIDNKHDGE
jgi:hypothetical protein